MPVWRMYRTAVRCINVLQGGALTVHVAIGRRSGGGRKQRGSMWIRHTRDIDHLWEEKRSRSLVRREARRG